jgi:hypothetical protein
MQKMKHEAKLNRSMMTTKLKTKHKAKTNRATMMTKLKKFIVQRVEKKRCDDDDKI